MLLELSLLTSTALAAATPPAPVFIPTKYTYGGYPKISTDILWGTPPQKNAVNTVVDLGSANFWVFGPNSTVNYGSRYHFTQGQCNQTARPFYNYPRSKTATGRTPKEASYGYGGNGKLVSGHYTLNDTISFGAGVPSIANQRVEVTDYEQIAQYATECNGVDYDSSILGIAPIEAQNAYLNPGPSFRGDLASKGQTSSASMSMWMDAAPAAANGTFKGTVLFGALPGKDKYTGALTCVKPNPPSPPPYVGYYVSRPVFQVSSLKNPSGPKTTLNTSDNVPQCLLDSGSGQDYLPIKQSQFLKVTGLVLEEGLPAFNGSCDAIPRNATLDFVFAGATASKSVTVKVPLRNYARGSGDPKSGRCRLSMELDEVGSCTLAAPFFTAAFLAVNDDTKQIALAQGGVSSGAAAGSSGLGATTVVPKGGKLPCV